MSETARALARYAMATSRVAPGLYNPASAMDQVLERIQPGLSSRVTTKADAMIKAGVHSTTALEQALTEEFDLLYPGAGGVSGLGAWWDAAFPKRASYPKASYPKAAFPKFPKAWFPKQGMSGLGAEAVDTSTRSGGSFGLTRRAASMATAPLPRKQTMMAQATEHVALLDRLMAAVPSNARLVTALRDATDRADAFVNGRGVQNSPWAGEWWVRRLQETISRARTVLSAYGPISRVSGSMSGLGACSCSCEDAGLGTPSTPGRTPTSSGTPASSGTSVSYGTLTPTGTPPRTPASPERLAAIGNMFSGIGSAIESLATGITAAVTGGLEQSRARDQQAFDNRMAEAVAAREAAEAAALREAQSILPVASVGGIGGGTILLGVLGLAVAGGAIYLISKKKD